MKWVWSMIIGFSIGAVMVLMTSVIFKECEAQEKLNLKQFKDKPGWVCYDEPSTKKIDEAMKRGVNCVLKLEEAQNTITKLKAEQQNQVLVIESQPVQQRSNQHWIYLGIGFAVGGLLGLAIGSSL